MRNMFLVAAFVLAATSMSGAAGIIYDGNVMLGIKDTGALNAGSYSSVSSVLPPSPGGVSTVGLRYIPTGNEATSHGCLCEGWGAGIATAGGTKVTSGFDGNGDDNLSVVSFTSDGKTATSVTKLT